MSSRLKCKDCTVWSNTPRAQERVISYIVASVNYHIPWLNQAGGQARQVAVVGACEIDLAPENVAQIETQPEAGGDLGDLMVRVGPVNQRVT
jgi:hypothetical protein